MIQSKVRQYLRDQQGRAQCARCMAAALRLDYESVRDAMDELAPRQPFSRGPCACGAVGLSYGWLNRPST
jgi:hypothetical protein